MILIWSPVVLYFVCYYPEWSWWYRLKKEQISLWYGVLPLVLQWILMVGGYVWVARSRLENRVDQARNRMLLSAVLAGIIVLLPLGIVMQVGTTEEYRSGRTQWLFQHGMLLELIGLGFLVVLGWLGVVLGWSRSRES